jgi:hypothetical protein
MWIYANVQDKIVLRVNNSTVVVKTGDLFKESGLKVIAFNEYFDTQVDNIIIADNSLNGIFLKNVVGSIEEFDKLIENDSRLNGKISEICDERLLGKKKRYELGTIIQYGDYLPTAFLRFDTENRATLTMKEYIQFLLEFWNQIDIVYAGRSISIPLLGSGITRFKEYDSITEQELLELLIWSFRLSRIKFAYPSCVTIVIHESRKDRINFFKLKEV